MKATIGMAAMTAAVTVATTPSVFAQADRAMPSPRVSIPDTEVHSMHSEVVGDDFELWIARPQAGFVPLPEGSVGVLYVLDANLFFGTAVEMTRLMHKLFGELPPLLVVGVAYPTDDGLLQAALRARDFTPSEDTTMATPPAAFASSPEARRVRPAMGGAGAFFRFIEEEVKPYVAARYDVGEETLFGASLGGLFVTHVLLTDPSSFDHFIAVSPSLWWNGEEAFAAAARRTRPAAGHTARVVVAVGGREEAPEVPRLAAFKMVTNARRMAALLAEEADPALDVHFELLDGETHTSVVPAALTRALRALMR